MLKTLKECPVRMGSKFLPCAPFTKLTSGPFVFVYIKHPVYQLLVKCTLTSIVEIDYWCGSVSFWFQPPTEFKGSLLFPSNFSPFSRFYTLIKQIHKTPGYVSVLNCSIVACNIHFASCLNTEYSKMWKCDSWILDFGLHCHPVISLSVITCFWWLQLGLGLKKKKSTVCTVAYVEGFHSC